MRHASCHTPAVASSAVTLKNNKDNNVIKVLVVDDHDLVRAGISSLLKDAGDIAVIGEAESGEDAIKQVREERPDVVLMDVMMPGVGGLEATRRITHYDESIKVIVVTALDDDVYPARLLQAGAAGYLTKGAEQHEMVTAIHDVMRGQRYISPDIAQKMALKNFGGGEAGAFDSLSERELQIAMMIVSCRKVNEIAESLFLSPKTVNTYRYRIFAKLDINSDVELTLLAVRHGLIDASEAANTSA